MEIKTTTSLHFSHSSCVASNMAPRSIVVSLCICAFVNFVSGVNENDSKNRNSMGSRGFDAKTMLSSLATNLMSRGYTNGNGNVNGNGSSQVVSLNLTNLLVLILLKALIFAAGSLGASTWKGGHGRSNDEPKELITEEEIMLYLSYLTGTPGDNGCLQNIACQRPEQAKSYGTAGNVLLKAAQSVSLDTGDTYENVLRELQEATDFGFAGGDCKRYHCGEKSRT